jgi:hypothetical protein
MTVTAKTLIGVFLSLGVAACGGGGGGSTGDGPPVNTTPQLSINYNPTSVRFYADAPWAKTPSDQVIVGTISSTGTSTGTGSSTPAAILYIIVVVNNPELVTVKNIQVTGQTSGQATLVAASPATLGGGTHQGSITVHACMNDSTCKTGEIGNSPQTIAITYTIDSNVFANTVSPHVVPAGKSGTVILRAPGLGSATSVTFGSVAATNLKVVSSTELHVDYPALPAGTYPVSIAPGNVTFAGDVVAVDPPGFPAGFLQYPAASPAAVQSLEYDAQRQALLLAISGAGQPSQLVRYTYANGSWSAPVSAQISNLQQIRISPDGSRVLVLRKGTNTSVSSMDALDAQTLTTLDTTQVAPDNLNIVTGTSFAIANDGQAVVTTQIFGSGNTVPQLYDTAVGHFSLSSLTPTVYSFSTASGDGSAVVLSSGQVYNPSTGTFQQIPAPGVSTGFSAPGSADLTGTKFQSGVGIYDSNLHAIGLVPTSQVAAVIDRTGKRVYTLDPAGTLRTFDVSTAPAGGSSATYPEVGAAIALAGDPGELSSPPPQILVTPDGTAVFIAGFQGIAVQPTPP